jgi:hypothetical protein
MEKIGAYWSARRSKGRVSLHEMMGREKGIGEKRFSKRDQGTRSTVMGLRLFVHMERRFLVLNSAVRDLCVSNRGEWRRVRSLCGYASVQHNDTDLFPSCFRVRCCDRQHLHYLRRVSHTAHYSCISHPNLSLPHILFRSSTPGLKFFHHTTVPSTNPPIVCTSSHHTFLLRGDTNRKICRPY